MMVWMNGSSNFALVWWIEFKIDTQYILEIKQILTLVADLEMYYYYLLR